MRNEEHFSRAPPGIDVLRLGNALLVSIRNYLKSDRQIDLNQILEQTIFNGIVFIAREVGIAVSIYSHVKQTLRGMSSFS